MSQRAFFLEEKQGEWAIRERAIPVPRPGEVLVRVEAAALNPVDWKMQKFGIILTEYPAVMGLEGAGVVEGLGDGVNVLKKGDRVLFPGDFNPNPDTKTFQQFAVVEASFAAKLPNNISFEQGAAMAANLATAAFGLYISRDIERGGAGLVAPWIDGGKGKYANQAIVVLGGSSSVGLYAIQLAKLSGFFPIIASASPQNEGLLKSMGATHFVDRKVALLPAVRAITTAPVNLVFDAISLKDTQESGWGILSPDGTLVVTQGPLIDIPDGKDEKRKISHLFARIQLPDQRAIVEGLLGTLPQFLADGSLKPIPLDILPGGLAAIPAGLKLLEENKVSGQKLVVKPQQTSTS